MRTLLAIAAGLVLGLGGARAQGVGHFERRFSMAGAVLLTVTNEAGPIEVQGMPGTAVVVDATVHARAHWFGGADSEAVRQIAAHPPVSQAGNIVSVEPLPAGLRRNVWIAYHIITPPGTQVRARTGSGAILVAGVDGGADLHAGSGSIKAEHLNGGVRAETGSGSIRLEAIGGDVRAQTGSGSIEGSAITGRLEARTGSGSLRMRQLVGGGEIHAGSGSIHLQEISGDLLADAGSGSIEAGGVLAPQHRWDLSTGSGGIRVELGANPSAAFKLHTGSGAMRVDLPVNNRAGKHEWQGVVGGGRPSAHLTASTGSGNITVGP